MPMIITCNPAFMHSINQIFSYNLDDQQVKNSYGGVILPCFIQYYFKEYRNKD